MPKRRSLPPLIVEEQRLNEFQFISYVEYANEEYVGIINYSDDEKISLYVIDDITAKKVNVALFLQSAKQWFNNNDDQPFSIFLSRNGLAQQFEMMVKTFDRAFVTRVITQRPTFFNAISKTKRRRITSPTPLNEVVIRKTVVFTEDHKAKTEIPVVIQ